MRDITMHKKFIVKLYYNYKKKMMITYYIKYKFLTRTYINYSNIF